MHVLGGKKEDKTGELKMTWEKTEKQPTVERKVVV